MEQRLSVTDLLNKTQDNMKKDSLENTQQKGKCMEENVKNGGEQVSEKKLIQNNKDDASINDSDSLSKSPVNGKSNSESNKLNGEINTNEIPDAEKDLKIDSGVGKITDAEKRKELHQHFIASVEALKTVSHSHNIVGKHLFKIRNKDNIHCF